MSITAKELAKKLNLSAAAVSMALNNKPGVSTDTRRRILDAADRYGYDFTRITEKQNAAGTIYLVIYKKHGAIVDDTPFFSQLSEGITDACQQSGYKLKILCLLGENDELLPQIEEIQYFLKSSDHKDTKAARIFTVFLRHRELCRTQLRVFQSGACLRHVLIQKYRSCAYALHRRRLCRYERDFKRRGKARPMLFRRQ